MKWDNIDLKKGVIVLDADHVKEGKIRTGSFETEALEFLVKRKEINDKKGAKGKDHVFGVTLNKPLTYQTFYKNYRAAVENTPYDKFNIHDQRHSYTTRMSKEGHRPEVIMLQQGHSTRSSYDWYNFISEEEVVALNGIDDDNKKIIFEDVKNLMNKMKNNDISIATLNTLIRENL